MGGVLGAQSCLAWCHRLVGYRARRSELFLQVEGIRNAGCAQQLVCFTCTSCVAEAGTPPEAEQKGCP